MPNGVQPSLDRMFLLSVHGQLPAEIADPRGLRGRPVRIMFRYDHVGAGDKVFCDISLAVDIGEANEDQADREPELLCALTVRSVWSPEGVNPKDILSNFAMPYLRQESVEAMNRMLTSLGVGTMDIEPDSLELRAPVVPNE